VAVSLHGLLHWRADRARRHAADELLRSGFEPHGHRALRARAAELRSDRNRHALARSLHAVVHELEGGTLPGASPLNRVAARPQVELFRQLESRLLDAKPVAAQGVALVENLLTDGSGPLYDRERAGELRTALEHCLAHI
jgi:hypothetical protein